MNEETVRLLGEVSLLRTDPRHRSRATEERFNIFTILGIERRETLTHSPLLAELLSPNGSHGMGPVFLELFLAEFKLGIDPARTMVKLEHVIAPVKEDFTFGGRIDILLTQESENERQTVIIENKIDAADQPNQLYRYQRAFPEAIILYLTLYGREAAKGMHDPTRVRSISYRYHIINWLVTCIAKIPDRPILRGTLQQYINILKGLTGHSFMNTEVAALVTQNEASLVAYFELVQSNAEVITRVIDRLRKHVADVARELKLTSIFPAGSNLLAKYETFSFYDQQMEDNNVYISFTFRHDNHVGFAFGVAYKERGPPEVAPPGILDRFQKLYPRCFKSPNYWPVLTDWDKYSIWKADEYAAIFFGEGFKNDLRTNVETVAEIVRSAISARP